MITFLLFVVIPLDYPFINIYKCLKAWKFLVRNYICTMEGYMYILECSDGSFYVGSTHDLDLRLAHHQIGEGANYTKKLLPVKLIYYEHFARIDEAFYREKQVQGWSRRKKLALINNNNEQLPELSKANRDR